MLRDIFSKDNYRFEDQVVRNGRKCWPIVRIATGKIEYYLLDDVQEMSQEKALAKSKSSKYWHLVPSYGTIALLNAIQYFLIEIGKITAGDNIWVDGGTLWNDIYEPDEEGFAEEDDNFAVFVHLL